MRKSSPIIIGLVVLILALWLQLSNNNNARHFVERLEHLTYDLQIRTQKINAAQFRATSPVAIIDIDDKSLQREGRWPWPRGKVGQLVEHLKEQRAAVIAFDVLFAEKERNIAETINRALAKKNVLPAGFALFLTEHANLFDEDLAFANSLKGANTVLALTFLPRPHFENNLPPPLFHLTRIQQDDLSLITGQGYISNLPSLQDVAKLGGFINIYPDSDGVIRRAPLLIEYKEGVYPALALQSVMAFLNVPVSLITPSYGNQIKLEGIRLGNQAIRTDVNGKVFVPFIGQSYTFPYYSATDVLHNNIPEDALLGKIVFIGTSATGEGDIKPTAIDTTFPGVEVQASLAYGLLRNNFAYKPAWTMGEQLVLTAVLGGIALFLFPHLGPKVLSLIIILFPPLMFYIHYLIWQKTGLLLSFLIPTFLILLLALINMIYGYLFETRRREHLKHMFGQYVPEEHINEMIKKTGSTFALSGEDREMTVLFADIRNFTAISESLSASQLVDMLNTYLTSMTEIIFKYHGTIDKYVGDLIMAFWGAPLKDGQHTLHACQAALEMQQRLKQLNQEKVKAFWPILHIGIGINSGIMSVGDMGSTYRRNYTVLGDAVNLASRLENLTKFYGVQIIVANATADLHQLFVLRQLDIVRVKGKAQGQVIYELIAYKTDVTAEQLFELQTYQRALDAYYAQEWALAKKYFTELHQSALGKPLYKIYLDRIARFEENPPSSGWDKIYTHHDK